MTNKARQRAIVETLESGREYAVSELALAFGTSEISIRRDLAVLARKGLVERTHGGAMKPDKSGFSQKTVVNSEAKAWIGRKAAELVDAGDVIFLDCGSTVFQMCRHLKQLSELTVITNSIPVLNELLGQPGVTVNFIGGEVDAARKAVHGMTALEHIGRYRADKAFVGVDGISLAHGLTANSEKEASLTLALSRQARHTYILCDSAKFEKDRYIKFGELGLAAALITDAQLPEELKRAYEEAGAKIIN